ncbi:hypothetical protein [Levilactobacillus namurensis]|uniref:hypothetical protein n=1 Tax=Levilactobacillus namurensis TaxID=380393 RepID=UPI0026ED6FE0|nr:hypothetical protein [Levilactobacillus namurensis]
MADSSRTIMTDAGFALEARIRAGQTKIEFTRASISTADHFKDTDDVLAKLTVLDDVQQDGQVTDVQVIDDTTVHVQIDVDQTKAPADYEMRSAGLYAKDDDGAEVLYGVTVLQDPVYVHKDDDGSYLGFSIDTAVGRSASVTIKANPANMVTQQAFESTMKNYYTKAEVDAKFVTDDDFASKLPKNIATTDAANTFAKSQTLAGGATDGKGNAYATTKDVATGLNNGLSTKVTDNKDGTEQLNGVQVQPFNKLSDTIGGRNYLLNSDQPITVSDTNNRYVVIPTKLNTLSAGNYIFTADVSGLVGNQTSLTIGLSNPSNHNDNIVSDVPIINGTVTKKMTVMDGDIHNNIIIYSGPNAWAGSAGCTVTYTNYQLIKSDVVKDWSPAPEDKVNVTDMRKPARKVAGIDEVNAKQDKIGYTPADDSKVVHDNGNGTITVNGQTYTPANDVYAIKRNDAGNTVGTVKMPDGNLQSSNGLHYYPVQWFGSYDEAMAYSKTHPYIDCRW